MTAGDYFVCVLIALNLGASITYGVKGYGLMAVYWILVAGLNACLLAMRLRMQ